MHILKTLIAHVRQYKIASLLTPLFTALEVLMEVFMPLVMALIIDEGINGGNVEVTMKYGALMLLLACLSLAFGALGGRFGAKASTGFACNLRDALFTHIQDFSFSNIDKFSSAGLVTRMTTDVTNVQNAFQMLMRIAVRAPLTLITSLIMCLTISLQMSSIFLVALVILAIVLTFVVSRTMPIFAEVFKKYDDLNASVQENVTAIRVVKAFVREPHENEKFNAAATNLYRMFVKAERILILNGPVMNLLMYGCIITISWFGAHFVVGGTLTTGELTALLTYVMSVLMSLMMLSMIFVMLTMSLASAKRIVEVLDEQPDIANPENPLMSVAHGGIEFDHASFAYADSSDENTLHDLTLRIEPGETVGIVGGTGSGKSSFANLISRLYDVNEGAVRVGGEDVRAYDLDVLRSQVAVVLQNNVLFSGTILDNLRWGNEDATEEQCIEACRAACADDFIQSFPEGYQTRIEQGGTNVSGGQKQRLCIARALLKEPKVLILDDSTSAVDTATDARIRARLAEDVPGMTKLIIAQRIASVQDADRIIVLEGGRLSGMDTHENLLANNAIYREIYDLQTKGGGDFDEPEPEDLAPLAPAAVSPAEDSTLDSPAPAEDPVPLAPADGKEVTAHV